MEQLIKEDNMVIKKEKTVFKTNKKEALKRKSYIAAIKGLMTLAR